MIVRSNGLWIEMGLRKVPLGKLPWVGFIWVACPALPALTCSPLTGRQERGWMVDERHVSKNEREKREGKGKSARVSETLQRAPSRFG